MGKDPAYLCYPANIAEDIAHMKSKSEKGCYLDIMQAQRKFGRLKEDQILIILGEQDFQLYWNSLKMILEYENGFYFIAWLDQSLEKRKAHSEKQKENANKRWNTGGKSLALDSQYQNGSTELPSECHGITDGMPLENAIENENEFPEGGTGETYGHTGIMDIDLILEKVYLDKESFCRIYFGWGLNATSIYEWLQAFNKFLKYSGVIKKTERDYRFHFGNWLKDKDLNATPASYEPVKKILNNGKITKSVSPANGAGKF